MSSQQLPERPLLPERPKKIQVSVDEALYEEITRRRKEFDSSESEEGYRLMVSGLQAEQAVQTEGATPAAVG